MSDVLPEGPEVRNHVTYIHDVITFTTRQGWASPSTIGLFYWHEADFIPEGSANFESFDNQNSSKPENLVPD